MLSKFSFPTSFFTQRVDLPTQTGEAGGEEQKWLKHLSVFCVPKRWRKQTRLFQEDSQVKFGANIF